MFFNRTNKSSRIFPKPAAIPLHLHDNGWCQKERPCGGKKIRAANENRNFTEVFGLYDYRILISEKWIQRRLTNVLKNGNRIQKWHSHQRNSDERRVWLVHASCIGFSPRLCSQAWKWSLRFTSMTSFLWWSMQTKWYDKSRNGVSFDWLACNRQKEALFLMPYYWDMKGWRATVSCRLDCAIKMELRVVAIKVSRCQHGKQSKVLGSIVLKYFKANRQGFFLPCHSRRKFVWGTRTVFLRRRLTFIQNTHERMRICKRNRPFKTGTLTTYVWMDWNGNSKE